MHRGLYVSRTSILTSWIGLALWVTVCLGIVGIPVVARIYTAATTKLCFTAAAVTGLSLAVLYIVLHPPLRFAALRDALTSSVAAAEEGRLPPAGGVTFSSQHHRMRHGASWPAPASPSAFVHRDIPDRPVKGHDHGPSVTRQGHYGASGSEDKKNAVKASGTEMSVGRDAASFNKTTDGCAQVLHDCIDKESSADAIEAPVFVKGRFAVRVLSEDPM